MKTFLVTLAATIGLVVPATPAEAYSTADVKAIIRDVFPDAHEDAAIRVARCESQFKPTARNRWHYSGVFQMGRREWRAYGRGGNVFNPRDNAEAALRLFRARGWQPWSCARIVGLL